MSFLFSTWTRDETVEAIRELELGLASGETSISSTISGSLTRVSRTDAVLTLRSLYGRLADIDGVPRPGRARRIRMVP